MSRKHSTAMGVGAAVAGAAVATFLSLGTAPAALADDSLAPDGYSDLFGATGTAGYPAAAGVDNAALDESLFLQNPGTAASFDLAVDQFESANAHPIADLINALDPSAFTLQHDVDIAGTINLAHDYLVPVDSLGYLATELDFFLLDPTGLGFLLSPVIELLVGSPPF
jgi:hypothetical protein